MNAQLHYIKGDATKPIRLDEGSTIYLPHCCNDKGGWGSGFVNAITKQFGETPRNMYKEWYHGKKASEINAEFGVDIINVITQSKFSLGGVQLIRLPDNIVLANMIGQHNYGPSVSVDVAVDNELFQINRPPIRYGAMVEAMSGLIECIENTHRYPGYESSFEIHAPKFGSDLAGGDWKIIEQMILEIWVDRGANVIVYEWVK